MSEVSVWRRLRLFGRFTWRFMRTGDERWMDVAVFALQSRLEFSVVVRAHTLAMTRAVERWRKAMLQDPPATEVVEGEGMRR